MAIVDESLLQYSLSWLGPLLIRIHSPFSLSMPRNRELRKPRASLFSPPTYFPGTLQWALSKKSFLLLSLRALPVLHRRSWATVRVSAEAEPPGCGGGMQ